MSRKDYLLVAALAVAALFPILWNGFVWDDVPETFSIEYTKDWRNVPRFFTSEVSGYYRPVRSIVYLLGRSLPFGFGDSPATFHALSLLWHALSTVAAAWLVSRFSADRLLALLAGVAFAIHPVHTEAVAWVTASSDPLVAPLVFLAAGLFVEARRREEAEPRRSRRLLLLGGLVTLAACFTKEVAVVLFLLVAALEALPVPGAGRTTRAGRLLRVGSALAPAAIFLAVRTAALGGVAPHAFQPGGSTASALAAFLRVAAEYLRMMLVPVGMRIHWEVDFDRGPLHPATLAAAALVAGLLAAAWVLRRRAPWASLGVVWFYATLLPVSNVVPLNQFASEKYLYLPSFGACLVLGGAAAAIFRRAASAGPSSRRAAIATGAALAVLATGATLARTRVFKDDVTLWTDALAKEPESTRARFQLARALWLGAHETLGSGDVAPEARDEAEATLHRVETLLAEAGALDPGDAWALVELGRIRMSLAGEALRRGDAPAAVRLRSGAREALEASIAARPEWGRPHYFLGLLLAEDGLLREAALHLETARGLDARRGPRGATPITATRFDPRLTEEEEEDFALLERALATALGSPAAGPSAVAPAGASAGRPPAPALPPVASVEEAHAAVAAALQSRASADLGRLRALFERAVDAVERYPAAAVGEEQAVLHLRLGWVLARTGDARRSAEVYARAVPLMEEEARRNPGSADVAFYLAEALLGAGRREEARAALARCLAIDPGYRHAPQLLDLLE